jgi:hypothetical protein
MQQIAVLLVQDRFALFGLQFIIHLFEFQFFLNLKCNNISIVRVNTVCMRMHRDKIVL